MGKFNFRVLSIICVGIFMLYFFNHNNNNNIPVGCLGLSYSKKKKKCLKT